MPDSAFDDDQLRRRYYQSGCHADFPSRVPLHDCATGDLHSPLSVALFGDSKAAQWFHPLEAIAFRMGWRLEPLTKAGCPPVPAPTRHHPHAKGDYPECNEWRQIAMARLERERPRLAILSFYHHYLHIENRPLAAREWAEALTPTLQRLVAAGIRPVLLLDTPCPGFDPIPCLRYHKSLPARCALTKREALDACTRKGLVAAAAAVSAATWNGSVRPAVVDPADWFCEVAAMDGNNEDAEELCPAVVAGRLVYLDPVHASSQYLTLLGGNLMERLAGLV